MNWLEKRVDELNGLDSVATVRLAIQCLQMVTDFRGNEIEVGVVQSGGRFHLLDEATIEAHIIAINETD